ncbi:putative porin [Flavobacterium ovatum]|uniref:putative porin n=1 Tax=Flavobacterium ovatum TaxID=1928857 RepID=UPI00344FC352
MRILFYIFIITLPTLLFSQAKPLEDESQGSFSDRLKGPKEKDSAKVATLDMYRFISLERDTTYIDTSLTIQREYSHNYLRRDTFGLLAFPNEGQTYNTLQYSLTNFSPYPDMGLKGKHFSFMEAGDIRYASVATPVTELFFKSIIGKGQLVDSYFTLNIHPRLNFSIAYKGIRSEGKYINHFANSGHFRFTTSYSTKNGRYVANTHFVSQDILNEENGGITTINDFESADVNFNNRQSLEVYLTDAESFLKGKRYFLDHSFRVNPKKGSNNLYVNHQFNYENKFFEYKQPTVASTVTSTSGASTTVYRFGDSYVTSSLKDHTHYNKMYNKAGLTYENTTLGRFQFYLDDFRSNFYYYKILVKEDGTIVPASFTRKINTAGGQYDYQKNKWTGKFLYSRSITNQSLSNLDAKMKLDWNDDFQFDFQYQNINKLPSDNYNLYQSSFIDYNWTNSFKNEKINRLAANAITPWLNASLTLLTLDDHLYFENVATSTTQQIMAPNQYEKTISYLSLKVSKEIKFGKFGFDNTILYQKVDQQDAVLNVPELVTRNTLYYTNFFFDKALFLQTGVSLNYFTKYYGNDYNGVIGEFFVQNQKQIGNYPNLDFFVNAKIQRTRIFIKAEHFNSSLSGNNYYSAPNTPFRDMAIRFGLVWNFFN